MSDTNDINAERVSDQIVWMDATGAPAISPTESTQSQVRGIVPKTQGALALAQKMDIDVLWQEVPGTSSHVVKALELLKQAIEMLGQAMRSENAIESDRFVQRAQLTLPKLFALRSIGDGFGVVINSLYFAFTNLNGTPMRPDQVKVAWRVLRELRNTPVMSLDQGIQRVEELEASGLEVDPSSLGDLLEHYESGVNE
jgi:hypothetical protein